jgi:hypothetical protein
LTRTQLFNHLQRIARTRIVNHRKINVGDNDLARLGRPSAGMLAENFLGDGMTHRVFS